MRSDSSGMHARHGNETAMQPRENGRDCDDLTKVVTLPASAACCVPISPRHIQRQPQGGGSPARPVLERDGVREASAIIARSAWLCGPDCALGVVVRQGAIWHGARCGWSVP